MASESATREEEIVDGKYRLGAVLSRSVRSTVYETEIGGDHSAAAIKVRERGAGDGPGRHAMELEHPNLLTIYATGSSTLDDVPVTYAVMERADESLEGVLSTRPLTGAETRDMLTPATAALLYLHKKGYAHSRLRASNVLAVGEQVKVSSDSVTRMSDGGSAAEDMRALGALIVQALTLHSPNANVAEEMPQPFREIAERCLDPDPGTRWTAAQVLARLAIPEPVLPLPTHQLHVQRIPVVEAPVGTSGEEEIRDEETQGDAPKKIPYWIYAALAALLLIVFLVAGLRKKEVAEPARLPAEVARQAPPAAVPAPIVAPAGDRKAGGWSVISAAYASRELAEKRMRAMAKRWPRFTPSVFQPRTGKTHYVVILGQNLSEDAAEALRKRAVAAGLPRDTYIKKMM